MDWADWIQAVGGNVIGKATDAQYVQPYEIQKLELQALGQGGFYREGKPGMQNPNSGAFGGISPNVLLLGGAALVAVLLLKG